MMFHGVGPALGTALRRLNSTSDHHLERGLRRHSNSESATSALSNGFLIAAIDRSFIGEPRSQAGWPRVLGEALRCHEQACENRKSMPCIFCRATENLTDEHVFPAFSGANLVVPSGSCKPCNNTCSKFEQKIAAELETTRHIFEMQDRYGEVPNLPVAVEVRGEGTQPVEVRGRRTPEGEIELYDFVSEAKVEDGKKVRHGFFVSAESAEKFLERSRRRGEKTTELGVPKELTLQSSAEQTITFAFTYEARQLAAKIALVSLAFR